MWKRTVTYTCTCGRKYNFADKNMQRASARSSVIYVHYPNIKRMLKSVFAYIIISNKGTRMAECNGFHAIVTESLQRRPVLYVKIVRDYREVVPFEFHSQSRRHFLSLNRIDYKFVYSFHDTRISKRRFGEPKRNIWLCTQIHPRRRCSRYGRLIDRGPRLFRLILPPSRCSLCYCYLLEKKNKKENYLYVYVFTSHF
jgi:hypothetical protein